MRIMKREDKRVATRICSNSNFRGKNLLSHGNFANFKNSNYKHFSSKNIFVFFLILVWPGLQNRVIVLFARYHIQTHIHTCDKSSRVGGGGRGQTF